MVVDTSALVAVLFGEPEEEIFLRILLRASGACLSSLLPGLCHRPDES